MALSFLVAALLLCGCGGGGGGGSGSSGSAGSGGSSGNGNGSGGNSPVPTLPTAPGQHALNVVVSGAGEVSSLPAGIQCGTQCTSSFSDTTSVTLTATAASGAAFSGWSGACSGAATSCTVSMTTARAVTATFATQRLLTLAITGSGSVLSSPAGISCGASCSAAYADGTTVTLTATAASGFTLTGWSGACSGANATCVVSMTSARNVSARFSGSTPSVSQCTQISQYSITFSLDRAYPCGTFANGDYWVTPTSPGGTVIIASISPAFTGSANGFEVNPDSVTYQGFDRDAADFDAARVPALPYAARAGQSIVKAISLTGDPKTVLNTAAVLTVLGSVPPDNGASVFRPPYFGSDKSLYSTNNLRLDKLARLPALANMPTLADIASRFQRVQLDHQLWWSANRIHPKQNMPHYGATIATDTAVAALRLMIDDTAQAKRQAAINYVQYGIDIAAARRGGLHFQADGGHRQGRKLLLAISALLLDDPGMATLVRDAARGTYQEDGQLYYSATAGKVLFGKECTESDYWVNQNTQSNSRDCRDPYGYIDGGEEPGQGYQFCCTVMPFKATALVLRLLPELRCIWTGTDLIDYADRWVATGTWTQPDPYAPHGNGARDTDPSDGTGRWPRNHGAYADGGYYGDPYADAMWSAYRSSAAPGAPACPR